MLQARGGCSISGSIPHLRDAAFWGASLALGSSRGSWVLAGTRPPPGSRVLAPVAASPPEQPGTIAHCGAGFQARPGNGSARRHGGKAAGGAGKLLLDGVQRPRRGGREPAVESKQRVERKVLTPKGGPGTPGTTRSSTTPGTVSPGRVTGAQVSKYLPAALNLHLFWCEAPVVPSKHLAMKSVCARVCTCVQGCARVCRGVHASACVCVPHITKGRSKAHRLAAASLPPRTSPSPSFCCLPLYSRFSSFTASFHLSRSISEISREPFPQFSLQ